MRASRNVANPDTFKSDLEIITTKALELEYYHQMKVLGIALSFLSSFGVAYVAASISAQNYDELIPILLITGGGTALGVTATNLWINWKYPNWKKGFNDLSDGARNYEGRD